MPVLELEWTPTIGSAVGRPLRRTEACRIPAPPRRARRPIARATVVWIDNDPLEWTHAAEHLMRCGYRVVPLPASRRGGTWVRAIAPDAVILEVDLEDEDGMGLLRSIRSENPAVPIFIYSRTDRYRDDFTSWLADNYLHKAEDVTPLCDAIEAALAARRRG